MLDEAIEYLKSLQLQVQVNLIYTVKYWMSILIGDSYFPVSIIYKISSSLEKD